MEWSDLRVFLAIAREGTLGGAAQKLGKSQPTMGRRLRALEQAVGQTLFQRTGDGFVLTDESRAVLTHVEHYIPGYYRYYQYYRYGNKPGNGHGNGKANGSGAPQMNNRQIPGEDGQA